MKKLLALGSVLVLATAAFAGMNDALLTFSTKGPDKYADGQTVLDGECYALVWTKAGATFGGIAADGAAVLPTDKVVLVAPVAKNGRCPTVLFQVDSKIIADEKLEGGSWGVYLLDTRVSKDGVVSVKGAPNGKLALVNGFGEVAKAKTVGAVGTTTLEQMETKVDGSQVAATGAALPKDVKQPRIKAIKIEGQYVKLTVENLPGFVRIVGGATLDAAAAQGAAQEANGGAEDVIIYAPKAEGSGFFKAIRNN